MITYLDGNPVQYPNDSLRKPRFTIRREDENGDKVIGFAGDLEFTGADKDYIYQKLVTDPNAPNNFVILKFVDDCCDTTGPAPEFQFQIKPESLEWCEGSNCASIKAAAVEYSISSEQYACLKNTLIFDNWNNFQGQQHPRITYCLEFRPSILQDAMIILCVILDAVLIALLPVIAVVAILITAVNAIIFIVGGNPIGGQVQPGILSGFANFFSQFNEFFIGCGRRHPSPLVRDYVQNVCGKCGLGFQSSIYNNAGSDYYNTTYFNAPVKKGVTSSSTSYWIDDNKPLLNGTRFLDQIKEPVNGRWVIRNNNVILERKDYFVASTPWLDLTTIDSDEIESICWQWSGRERPAYGNFQYAMDATDWVGNEGRDRWNDIVEWNSPPSPVQKGEYLKQLQFSPARFRDDGVERDVLSAYNNWPLVGPIISQYGRVMLMNNGTAFNPKLLIIDPAFGNSDARVALYYPPPINAALNQHYNYPFWFDQATSGNLYDRFWDIENPRNMAYRGFTFTATIRLTCARLRDMDIDGCVNTQYGNARIETIDIDYSNGQMTIRGEV